MSALDYVGEATPYVYIGDSHAGTIGHHVFRDPDGALIATKTISIWRFVAADVVGSDDMVGDALMQALRRTGAFHSSPSFEPVPGLRPVSTVYGNQMRTEYLQVLESARERPYVICVGEINTRYVLAQLVADDVDFAVPFSTAGLEQLPKYAAARTVAADRMLEVLLAEFQPLIKGLRILKQAGLHTVFLHSVPPPAVDDDDAYRVLKHPSPARLRYKLAMFVNFMYRAVCRELGVGFIDMWPQVTIDDLLDPRFYLDGLHLNDEHSKLSVAEVHRQLSALRLEAGIPNT